MTELATVIPTDAVSVLSGSTLAADLLDRGGWSHHRPKLAKRLRHMETNSLRYPMYKPARSSQLSLFGEPSVYGHPYVVAGSAKVRDIPLLVGLTSRFVQMGCPEDGFVPYTIEEAAAWLGYKHYGGREYRRVKTAIARLKSIVHERVAVRLGSGGPVIEELFGFFAEEVEFVRRGQGVQRVRLSRTYARLVREGSYTKLDNPTMLALLAADEVALRIWLFLEAESGPRRDGGWHYHVFPDKHREMPAISQLVWLQGARRKVLARLHQAFAVIETKDPRYLLSYNTGWLHAELSTETNPSSSVIQDGPQGVIETDDEGSPRRTARGQNKHVDVVENVVDDVVPSTDENFLRGRGYTVTPRVTGLLQAIGGRHGGRSWNLERLQEAPDDCHDLIAYLKSQDETWRPPPRPRKTLPTCQACAWDGRDRCPEHGAPVSEVAA